MKRCERIKVMRAEMKVMAVAFAAVVVAGGCCTASASQEVSGGQGTVRLTVAATSAAAPVAAAPVAAVP